MTDMGLSAKALFINIWSTLTFLLPIVLLVKPELLQTAGAAWVGLGCVTLLVPPIGWLKPHPHSDFDHNGGDAAKQGPFDSCFERRQEAT
eukprot:CAMPEP_0118863646 /NCGR_PEP_ID=MMETSP1163-20130328/8440_1 /TAXON_ID=124430 /ORGANISM="Phaeomonas parva, Strain CCMP2877" /LENGTH=89 /DNA_ID=CAMNT_0006797673 /DNA_START=143 /DNA_END=413 /DNA_ORIENTATION=+